MSILRFLLKSKDKNEIVQTDATPPATDTTCSSPSRPDALLSKPASTAEGPVQSPSSQDQLKKQLPPCISATSPLADQQEEVSPCELEQRSLTVVVGKEDGEKAGPSGLNTPSTSSFSAPSAFIPFSGGGQRLGGPRTADVSRSPSSALTLPSQSAPGAAVDSPKAKKAKSSYSFSNKVSAIT